MMIESRMIVVGAAALALVIAVIWCSAQLFAAAGAGSRHGRVEITQVPGPSWSVEIQDLGVCAGPGESQRAAVHR